MHNLERRSLPAGFAASTIQHVRREVAKEQSSLGESQNKQSEAPRRKAATPIPIEQTRSQRAYHTEPQAKESALARWIFPLSAAAIFLFAALSLWTLTEQNKLINRQQGEFAKLSISGEQKFKLQALEIEKLKQGLAAQAGSDQLDSADERISEVIRLLESQRSQQQDFAWKLESFAAESKLETSKFEKLAADLKSRTSGMVSAKDFGVLHQDVEELNKALASLGHGIKADLQLFDERLDSLATYAELSNQKQEQLMSKTLLAMNSSKRSQRDLLKELAAQEHVDESRACRIIQQERGSIKLHVNWKHEGAVPALLALASDEGRSASLLAMNHLDTVFSDLRRDYPEPAVEDNESFLSNVFSSRADEELSDHAQRLRHYRYIWKKKHSGEIKKPALLR